MEKDSRETAIGDSKWQKDADPQKWPTTEIYPGSAWNYSLVLDKTEPLKHFEVIRKSWPADDYPFTVANVPLEVKAVGRLVPEWEIDETGLCGVLPEEDAARGDKEEITLIPMGAARLRITAFPNTKEYESTPRCSRCLYALWAAGTVLRAARRVGLRGAPHRVRR